MHYCALQTGDAAADGGYSSSDSSSDSGSEQGDIDGGADYHGDAYRDLALDLIAGTATADQMHGEYVSSVRIRCMCSVRYVHVLSAHMYT
jgi:hypothetical protein